MPDNAREIFAKNLNYLMEDRGITQADICRDLDVSSATASDWCSGKKFPRIDKLQRIADLLGVRLSNLTSEDGLRDYEDQKILEDLLQDPKLRMLFDRARKMSDHDKDRMLRISDIIKDELYGE